MNSYSLTSSGILACRCSREDVVRRGFGKTRRRLANERRQVCFANLTREKLVRKRESTRADSKLRAYEIAATLDREVERELKVKRKRASWRQRVESKGVQW